MRVSVFGLGYVGCVSAGCLAREGHEVTGVDISESKVAMVAAGRSPIVEPGLDQVLAEQVRAGRLTATTSSVEAVGRSDVALICVGTPGRPNGQLSVDALVRVGREIGHSLQQRSTPFLVVLRSTVLPGTTEKVFVPAVREGAAGRASSLRFAVNPEFMREGTSLRDFTRPPFTLVGTADPEAGGMLRGLYTRVDAPFLETTVRTAEMVKYVSNSFHALKVSFANEIGDVCAALGVDAQAVMRIFLMDRKLNVSEAYLTPGFAFGGSCLPKDLRALLHAARSADVVLPVLNAVLPSNDHQIREAVDIVLAARKRRVGVVGLSFKAGTDDLRESPMVTLVETLIGKGCDVRILDRNVAIARLTGANRKYIEEEIPHIASLMCEDAEALLDHAEVIVIGDAGEEAVAVLSNARSRHVVVDLTRGTVKRPAPAPESGETSCDALAQLDCVS